MTDAAFDASEKFAPELAADTLGLTGKIRAFAFARWCGANRVDSAKAAGYGGEPATLRSTGSKADKSPKVQAFLRWAETGKSMPDEPGDLKEIEAKLWSQVRSTDVAAQRFAIDQLVKLRIIQPGNESPPAEKFNPTEALEYIATVSPLAAAVVARHCGLPSPPAASASLAPLCPGCLDALIKSVEPMVWSTASADGTSVEASAA